MKLSSCEVNLEHFLEFSPQFNKNTVCPIFSPFWLILNNFLVVNTFIGHPQRLKDLIFLPIHAIMNKFHFSISRQILDTQLCYGEGGSQEFQKTFSYNFLINSGNLEHF